MKNKKKNNLPQYNKSFFVYALLVLVILILMVYAPTLKNQLTNWDDNRYIGDNANIHLIHSGNIWQAVKTEFHSYVAGNYHPLTMLLYGLEFHFFEYNPKGYHAVSLFLHLINTTLVCWFIWLLTQRHRVAFITALLFALHPMHVESVAWASEQKDLLYSFFYLSALCVYVIYSKSSNRKLFLYSLVFLLFVLGVLSKAMAVSLPITLLLIDYLLHQSITRKQVLEKISFLLVSVIFGFVAIEAQKTLGAIGSDEHYGLLERIVFSSYGFITYLWKLLLPINLTCFYTYPLKHNQLYPLYYYAAPFVLAAVVYVIYKYAAKDKILLFGTLFFCVTIALVIQLFPVGEAILAERYTYLPYIGLFFIAAYKWDDYTSSHENKKTMIYALSGFVVLLFSFQSLQRVKVWKDSITLWDDAISKSALAPMPFYCRGWEHFQRNEYEKAIADYDKGIQLKKNFPELYYSKGIIYNSLQRYDEAIANYNLAIYYNPNYSSAYLNRGVVYQALNNYAKCIDDYSAAIAIEPNYDLPYFNRAMVNQATGNFQKAVDDYNTLLSLNPNNLDYYVNRGIAFQSMGNYDKALDDYTKVITANNRYLLAYHNRGIAYYENKLYDKALADFSAVLQLDSTFHAAYFYRINTFKKTEQVNNALMEIAAASRHGLATPQTVIDEIVKQKKE